MATNGSKVATVAPHEPIKVWDLCGLSLIREFEVSHSIQNPIAMSQDKIWTWNSLNEILELDFMKNTEKCLQGPISVISCLFKDEHDVNLVYLGTQDGTVEMFDLKFVLYLKLKTGNYNL
jgi:WD40 repeat protein